jgi:hypothetical protein
MRQRGDGGREEEEKKRNSTHPESPNLCDIHITFAPSGLGTISGSQVFLPCPALASCYESENETKTSTT